MWQAVGRRRQAPLTGAAETSLSHRHVAPKRALVSDRLWPDPGVRDRQLLGGSMRTAGFKQGNRKREDPQSTHRSRRRFSQRTTGLPGT
jgi:hypothetical protein